MKSQKKIVSSLENKISIKQSQLENSQNEIDQKKVKISELEKKCSSWRVKYEKVEETNTKLVKNLDQKEKENQSWQSKKGYWRSVYDQVEQVSKTQLELDRQNQQLKQKVQELEAKLGVATQSEDTNFQEVEAKIQEMPKNWK